MEMLNETLRPGFIHWEDNPNKNYYTVDFQHNNHLFKAVLEEERSVWGLRFVFHAKPYDNCPACSGDVGEPCPLFVKEEWQDKILQIVRERRAIR
ncbi:MAG TPA: hypothetical protein VJ824_17230 [Bacillota bacterium]|nr:hypothetical protein [Bacillota bacterium]